MYANTFNKPKETIAAWMNAETWWTGQDMVNMGLITAKNCGPAESAFTNSIPKEKWLFNNTAILNTINSSIKPPKNKDMKKNSIINAIEEGFKKYFTNNTLQNAKPDDLKAAIVNAINEQEDNDELDPAAISNAVNTAMTGDAFNTAIANGIKKVLEGADNPVNAAITTATNSFAKKDEVVTKTELETMKNDLADKFGTPTNRRTKPKNTTATFDDEEEANEVNITNDGGRRIVTFS